MAWRIVVAIGCLTLTACQLTPAPQMLPCPLPSTEQVQAILEIAPLGTPRTEVEQRLQEHGFAGTFGANQSIYYCDIWDQGQGVRWHINVILLFDDDGKLYATRPDPLGQVDPTPRDKASVANPSETAAPVNPFE